MNINVEKQAKKQMDVEMLLAPISGNSPVGSDIGLTDIIDEIEGWRKTEDAEGLLGPLKRGQARTADWQKVLDIAGQTLRSKVKDLRLAFYVADASSKINGLQGIRDGLELLQGLHDRFWPGVYPQIENADLEIRTAWLEKADKSFEAAIGFIPISVPSQEASDSYQFWQLQGCLLRKQAAPRNPNLAQRKVDIEIVAKEKAAIDKCVANTQSSFFDKACQDITLCMEQCEKLKNALHKSICNQPGFRQLEQAPSFYYTRTALQHLLDFFEQVLTARGPLSEAIDRVSEGEETSFEGDIISTSGNTYNRDKAIERLKEIAIFFQKSEPHSPVGYLIERAVRWSRMSLTELLDEMLRDAPVLAKVKDTLGISAQMAKSS